MAGVDIQAKVKKGLARAIDKTSSASADLVYKIERIGGGGDPITPIAPTETPILLVDAIFKSYNESNIDQTLIQSGDRQLVSNGDVVIELSDTIKVGSQLFIVENVDVKSPSGVPLAYIAQVRPSGYVAATPALSTVITLADAEPLTGIPNSSAFKIDEPPILGSMTPIIALGGIDIDGLYTLIDGGNYSAVLFGIDGGEGFPDLGDIAITIGSRVETFNYESGSKAYVNNSISSDLFDYMYSLIGIPTIMSIEV